MYNPFILEGKTILVTGASSGIGATVAIECSRLGANVIITARNEKRLLLTHQQLEGNNHQMITADISTGSGLETIVENILPLDGLAHCAGISSITPISFINREKLDGILQTNTIAPVLLTKSLVKRKKINTGASLVYVASISGLSNFAPGVSMYGVSKSALTAFVKYAAVELSSRKIRCNSIHPGRINTPLLQSGKLSAEDIERDIAQYPLKRYGEPEEVAHAAAFLLSDAAAWITGASLVVDGGRSLI